MVVESYHAGRSVPCPWCRARNDVPTSLDFLAPDVAQAKDEARGGRLLMFAVLGLFSCIAPLEAWVWWSAHGHLRRAEEDGRPGDGLVRAARAIAAVGTVAHIGGYAMLALN